MLVGRAAPGDGMQNPGEVSWAGPLSPPKALLCQLGSGVLGKQREAPALVLLKGGRLTPSPMLICGPNSLLMERGCQLSSPALSGSGLLLMKGGDLGYLAQRHSHFTSEG